MRLARAAAPLAAVALAVAAAPAAADDLSVAIPGRYFLPSQLQVVVGDTVTWHNGDSATHDLVASDGEFASGALSSGEMFAHTFAAAGEHPYVCTIHPNMTGEIDVVPITLAAPAAAPTAGERFTLSGRTEPGAGELTVERADSPAGPFAPAASATPAADGRYSVVLTAEETAVWRVSSGALSSPVVTVPVAPRLDLLLRAHLTRHLVVLTLRTRPARPGATVRLQLYSRERFSWVPAGHGALGPDGAVTFSLRRGLRRRARVAYGGGGAVVHSRAIPLWRVR